MTAHSYIHGIDTLMPGHQWKATLLQNCGLHDCTQDPVEVLLFHVDELFRRVLTVPSKLCPKLVQREQKGSIRVADVDGSVK